MIINIDSEVFNNILFCSTISTIIFGYYIYSYFYKVLLIQSEERRTKQYANIFKENQYFFSGIFSNLFGVVDNYFGTIRNGSYTNLASQFFDSFFDPFFSFCRTYYHNQPKNFKSCECKPNNNPVPNDKQCPVFNADGKQCPVRNCPVFNTDGKHFPNGGCPFAEVKVSPNNECLPTEVEVYPREHLRNPDIVEILRQCRSCDPTLDKIFNFVNPEDKLKETDVLLRLSNFFADPNKKSNIDLGNLTYEEASKQISCLIQEMKGCNMVDLYRKPNQVLSDYLKLAYYIFTYEDNRSENYEEIIAEPN